MAEGCVPAKHCSSGAAGWLNGSHPRDEDEGAVNRTVCFRWKDDCCKRKIQIKVRKCAGNFFLYLLKRNPWKKVSCSYRYCGNGEGKDRTKSSSLRVNSSFAICPLKFCLIVVFIFSCGDWNTQWKFKKKKGYAKVWWWWGVGANEVYHGMCKWLIWGRRVPYGSLRLPKMAALRLKIKLSSMVLSRKTFLAKHLEKSWPIDDCFSFSVELINKAIDLCLIFIFLCITSTSKEEIKTLIKFFPGSVFSGPPHIRKVPTTKGK